MKTHRTQTPNQYMPLWKRERERVPIWDEKFRRWRWCKSILRCALPTAHLEVITEVYTAAVAAATTAAASWTSVFGKWIRQTSATTNSLSLTGTWIIVWQRVVRSVTTELGQHLIVHVDSESSDVFWYVFVLTFGQQQITVSFPPFYCIGHKFCKLQNQRWTHVGLDEFANCTWARFDWYISVSKLFAALLILTM